MIINPIKMNESQKQNQGYTIIEPPIYEQLNWDMDSIVSCLEVIRIKLPELFNEFPDSIKYELFSLKNPHGKPYPVIGLLAKKQDDLNKITDFLDLNELVEIWINKIGIDVIKKKSKKLNVISWETLKKKCN